MPSKAESKDKPVLDEQRKNLSLGHQKINNIRSIFSYLDDLIRNKITHSIQLLKLRDYQLKDETKEEADLFKKQYEATIFFRTSRNYFPIRYELKHTTASEVQVNFMKCTTTLQKLYDKAREGGHLDKEYTFFMRAIKGFFHELLSCVDPIENKLTSRSVDNTHLSKILKGIYICGAKLSSLESKVFGKKEEIQFYEYLEKMKPEDQEELIKNYILSEYKPEWIVFFTDSVIQKTLEIIVGHPDLRAMLTPTMAIDLFQRYTTIDRREFIKILANLIDGSERMLLRGDKIPK